MILSSIFDHGGFPNTVAAEEAGDGVEEDAQVRRIDDHATAVVFSSLLLHVKKNPGLFRSVCHGAKVARRDSLGPRLRGSVADCGGLFVERFSREIAIMSNHVVSRRGLLTSLAGGVGLAVFGANRSWADSDSFTSFIVQNH